MEKFRPYKIPANILNVENRKNILESNDPDCINLKNVMAQSRISRDCYFSGFTALIHLEEASESKRISKFNFKNVRLELESSADQTFKINYVVSKILHICCKCVD